MTESENHLFVYLIREGKRYYKRVEIYARSILTKRLAEQEEVSPYDIPEEIREKLERQ